MHRRLVVVVALAVGCARTPTSHLRLWQSEAMPAASAPTWGALVVDITMVPPSDSAFSMIAVSPKSTAIKLRKTVYIGKQVDSLPTGPYSVAVIIQGYDIVKRDVIVQAGQRLRLRATMHPNPAGIRDPGGGVSLPKVKDRD